ncbi:neurofilament heavy polypeptide [Antennarius striatus]|uniref:neurofilament heavy polypeptide n=1 Tax=Antennarius striatus TaxID=241820 RepID=UPI0035B4B1A4
METKYPTLKRPKRKLCYVNLVEKECPSTQWLGGEPLSLGDIDKMFDDLESSFHSEDADILPKRTFLQLSDDTKECDCESPSVPQKEGHPTTKNSQCQKGPNGNVLHRATKSPGPAPDIDLDFGFSAHRPVKTSSPIEENVTVKGAETTDTEKHCIMSPILFACEDVEKEEAKMESLPKQKLQSSGQILQQSDDSELDSPPSKVVLGKHKISSHPNKVEESRREGLPVEEKAPKNMMSNLNGKRKALRQENSDPSVKAMTQVPVVTTPKKSEGVLRQQPMASASVGKGKSTFLQKLREATQPKHSCARKSLSPVKPPNPPEPEDDFLILEDDAPIFISIPSKSVTKRKKGKTPSTDKDSSTEKGVKETTLESAQKEQKSDQADGKLQTHKTEGKEKGKNEVTPPGYKIAEFCVEELPSDDLMEQEKPKKKNQQLKKLRSKQSHKAEAQESAREEINKEKNILKREKKGQTSSDTKESKFLKDGEKNGKTSKPKLGKGTRKLMQECGAVKEMASVELVKELDEPIRDGQTDAKGLDALPVVCEAHLNEKDEQTEDVVMSKGSSSEDSEVVGKRKRRQPGQWWLWSSQTDKKTEVSQDHLTPKKSKQNIKDVSAGMLSPVKTKKEQVSKGRNRTPTALSSSQKTDKVKEKKIKRKKKIDAVEAKPIEEQQGIQDQDLVQVQSSPFVLVQRDPSLNPGDQLFQRVYHNVSHEKMSGKPALDILRGPTEESRGVPEKRRRKPPSNWWKSNDVPEDVQNTSLQTLQQELKPRKKKKAQQSRSSGLGVPKNGNMAASLKPAGGTPASPLKVVPLSAPKTVKRSLATFKDIFTSDAETPAVGNRQAARKNKHKIVASPAVEVTVTDCTTPSRTEGDNLTADADAETHCSVSHEAPQNSRLRSLNSGPSSMIVLEQYEDSDDLILPSRRVSAVLSASDLCAAPLKPLILQPKDKDNLTKWFKCVWSITAEKGSAITPDQFDWYFHQGRAIGFMVDLNSGSICNGKMLLGSYMKKPLWVDHSATTVFNILTSSVNVIIDGCGTRLNPGQSFMVPCGHAYSIQNMMSQPAVVYFTRIFAESSD